MVNAQTVANTILMLSFKEKNLITLMKLQRIIYLVYKEYLKTTNCPLFSEQFEKWQYGSVLPSIHYKFKRFGADFIDRFSRDAMGNVEIINIESNTEIAKIIENVWNKYKNYHVYQLSALVCKDRGAWSKATNYILKDEDIKNELNFL